MGWGDDGGYSWAEPVCAWCHRPAHNATGGLTTVGDRWECPRCGADVPVRYARVTRAPDGHVERWSEEQLRQIEVDAAMLLSKMKAPPISI